MVDLSLTGSVGYRVESQLSTGRLLSSYRAHTMIGRHQWITLWRVGLADPPELAARGTFRI